MNQWLSVDQSYIAPYLRELAMQRIVRPHNGQETDEGAAAAAEAMLLRAFEVVEHGLREGEHLAGPTLSLADVSLAPYVGSLPMLGAEHVLRDLPRLSAWWSAVSARPSWKAAVAS
jgi:glutathione S-transferase